MKVHEPEVKELQPKVKHKKGLEAGGHGRGDILPQLRGYEARLARVQEAGGYKG